MSIGGTDECTSCVAESKARRSSLDLIVSCEVCVGLFVVLLEFT